MAGISARGGSAFGGEPNVSRDRGLNPGPHPYHGCALPAELSRRVVPCPVVSYAGLPLLALPKLS